LVLQVVETVEAGDHLLTICRVIDTLTWQPQQEQEADAGRIVSLLSQQQQPQRPQEDGNGAARAAVSLVRLDPSNTLYTGQLREEGIL
jgi:hypothetical protein